ncbi:hypothetical protein NPIL_659571 [Nephila pilipes]|uniref:Uncharacterized protein n=1 Tax=Nephila pilipes TaxID=299642 RepID=A0A8X6TER8_NEPPI|nr:hypothetical protein NPIL_659571 [Nephila pilipes]
MNTFTASDRTPSTKQRHSLLLKNSFKTTPPRHIFPTLIYQNSWIAMRLRQPPPSFYHLQYTVPIFQFCKSNANLVPMSYDANGKKRMRSPLFSSDAPQNSRR